MHYNLDTYNTKKIENWVGEDGTLTARMEAYDGTSRMYVLVNQLSFSNWLAVFIQCASSSKGVISSQQITCSDCGRPKFRPKLMFRYQEIAFNPVFPAIPVLNC